MPIPSPSSVLLRTQSDERLVVLARNGHERAFEAIVERYRGALLRAARRYLPDARAEDALQQAYLSAWSALQRGDEVRDLRAWLYRIVHNTALNQLRVGGYDYAELEESLRGGEAPQEEMERRAVVRQTLTGLAALPDRQREALLKIAVEGRSQEEVARALGVSEGAVRQLVHRARLTLRAAATALVPMPLAEWAAAAGASGAGAPTAERIAELVAGAGASAFVAKAATVGVIATTAVAGPAIVTVGRGPAAADRERAPTPSPRARTSTPPPVGRVDAEPRRARVGSTPEPRRATRRGGAAESGPDRGSAPARAAERGRVERGGGRARAGSGSSGSGSGSVAARARRAPGRRARARRGPGRRARARPAPARRGPDRPGPARPAPGRPAPDSGGSGLRRGSGSSGSNSRARLGRGSEDTLRLRLRAPARGDGSGDGSGSGAGSGLVGGSGLVRLERLRLRVSSSGSAVRLGRFGLLRLGLRLERPRLSIGTPVLGRSGR